MGTADAIDPETTEDRAGVRGQPVWILLFLAALSAGLAIYQWVELNTALSGGKLACSMSESVDCVPVWSSSFARAVHDALGVPVAGLGLVWSVVALALGVGAAQRALRHRPADAFLRGLQLVAAAGMASVLVLASVSLNLGVLCPTCLLTYLLVTGFALVSLRLRVARGSGAWTTGALLALGATAAAFAMARVPGYVAAPHAPRSGSTLASPAPPTVKDPVADALAGLDEEGRRMAGQLLAAYRQAPQIPRGDHPPRFVIGAADAPLKLVEWTDIKCGHCADFSHTLKEVMAKLPPGKLSVEPRQFPLAHDCNPAVTGTDPSGVRCGAALALICIEGGDQFLEAQAHLFAEQSSLTIERVMEVVAPYAGGEAKLSACMAAATTKERLADDLAFAHAEQIRGTPLILVNDKVLPPFGPLFTALILAGGDPNHPAFATLPMPRASRPPE
ncbi:MAG: vitamin K epoxide reductase family protein [Myxococcota bacterium]